MTTIEYTYSPADLRKRCYGCKFLVLKKPDDLTGDCIGASPRIKNRHRSILERSCRGKEPKQDSWL